jgi:hypothetical protein
MHGIKLPPYKPTVEDLTFTKNMITMLATGGIWGNKRAAMFYQKTGDNIFKLLDYMRDAPDEVKQWQAHDHHCMKACCKVLGVELDESILDNPATS